jgi:riboflavin synthase
MFTGIVEEAGRVRAIRQGRRSIRLTVEARVCSSGLKIGDSLAVNGCCLTVVGLRRAAGRAEIQFDLLRETWKRTNLSAAKRGHLVNLERPLAAGARLGGHFVTGHIDGVGRIARWERAGEDHVLEVSAPAAVRRYVVFKGSIAVDGISLTVAAVTPRGFRIWIIPHTCEVTALRERSVGDAVNLEADLLGKYVERFVRQARARRGRSKAGGRTGTGESSAKSRRASGLRSPARAAR